MQSECCHFGLGISKLGCAFTIYEDCEIFLKATGKRFVCDSSKLHLSTSPKSFLKKSVQDKLIIFATLGPEVNKKQKLYFSEP